MLDVLVHELLGKNLVPGLDGIDYALVEIESGFVLHLLNDGIHGIRKDIEEDLISFDYHRILSELNYCHVKLKIVI